MSESYLNQRFIPKSESISIDQKVAQENLGNLVNELLSAISTFEKCNIKVPVEAHERLEAELAEQRKNTFENNHRSRLESLFTDWADRVRDIDLSLSCIVPIEEEYYELNEQTHECLMKSYSFFSHFEEVSKEECFSKIDPKKVSNSIKRVEVLRDMIANQMAEQLHLPHPIDETEQGDEVKVKESDYSVKNCLIRILNNLRDDLPPHCFKLK